MRGWLFGGVAKSQAVYFVDYNGQRYKRVVFRDTRQAELVEHDLQHSPLPGALPRLIERHENEIWVEFVPGRRLDFAVADDCARLADFFGKLYGSSGESRLLAEQPCHDQLLNDLWFLSKAGVLGSARAAELAACAEQLRPDRVWCGFDYVDPVGKNFVVDADGLRAIDIESLQSGRLLGTGVAKCRIHAPQIDLPAFLEQVIAAGAPDLRPQFPYVELCFLAGWTKRKLLAGKRHYVRAERFDAF